MCYTSRKLFKMENKLIILALSHFFLCSACNENSKYKDLQDKLNINFKEGYVIVLSEYDCISCMKIITKTIEKYSNENLKVLYFLSSNKFVNKYPFALLKKYSHISSERIEKSLFLSISDLSREKSTPFLLKIKDGRIVDIYSFTKMY